jgi:lipoprotein NlpD
MPFLLALLVSCGFPLAPVSEQGVPMRHLDAAYREVQAGETLYSIAWDSGRDYRELARWNHIRPPYVIKQGQMLRLSPPAATSRASRPAPKYLPPSSSKPAAIEKRPDKKNVPADEPITPAPKHSIVSAASKLSWIRPTEGVMLARYSANGPNKGIDIAGRSGQPILAASAGQVVYQGGGLRGYGRLIIIKHNADFLSAYAHCDKIYVKEGNMIKQGQKIADMGSSGTDRAMLHFEIRYRGAPVDPQDYLPEK